MYLEDRSNSLVIRSITEEDLLPLWRLAYEQPQPEWMNWNGPYFHDRPFKKEEYLIGPGPAAVNRSDEGLILVDHQRIGQISWYWEDGSLQNWLEFGLALYPTTSWNKGIGTKACALWIDYLFQSLPTIKRVGFTTWSGNHRMMAVGEKLGMKLEARVRSVRLVNGQYYDSIKYGLLREEWLPLKGY